MCVGEAWRSGLAGACAFGTISRACPAALWPFLSPAPGEEGGFQQGSPLLPSLSQGFVLAVTIIREAVEEIRCYLRDKEVNSQVYSRLTARGQPPGSTGAASCSWGVQAAGEQNSRPGISGCAGAVWLTVAHLPTPREASVSPGAWGYVGCIPGLSCALRCGPIS